MKNEEIIHAMNVVSLPVDKVKENPANTRHHDENSIAKIKRSLEQYGQRKNIVVQKKNMICRAGNGMLRAAKELGWKNIAAVVVDEPSVDATGYEIMDNRSAEVSIWDDDTLLKQLQSLREDGFDLDATGFSEGELEELLDEQQGEGDGEEDEPPEPPEEPIVKTGQLWLLGKHRLLCGDCTKEEYVARLMNGEKADMCFTDPPYGVDYEGGHFHSGNVNIKRKRKRLQGDKNTNIYSLAVPILADNTNGPCYTWFAGTKPLSLFSAVEKVGQIHSIIVWHKINAKYAAMNSQYKQRHELCLYWKPKKSNLRWCGSTNERTVWEEKRDNKNNYHPTQKPICLAYRAIKNHKANIVLDLFIGSGSTLIACEQTGRRCYAMEIEPAYCQVTIERWQNFTGQEAIEEKSGKTLSNLS